MALEHNMYIFKTIFIRYTYVNVESNNCCWAYVLDAEWLETIIIDGLYFRSIYSSVVGNNKHGLSNDISEKELYFIQSLEVHPRVRAEMHKC